MDGTQMHFDQQFTRTNQTEMKYVKFFLIFMTTILFASLILPKGDGEDFGTPAQGFLFGGTEGDEHEVLERSAEEHRQSVAEEGGVDTAEAKPHPNTTAQMLKVMPEYAGPELPEVNITYAEARPYLKERRGFFALPQQAYDHSAKSWKINPVLNDKCGINITNIKKRPPWAQTIGVAYPPTNGGRLGRPRWNRNNFPPLPSEKLFIEGKMTALGGLTAEKCVEELMKLYDQAVSQRRAAYQARAKKLNSSSLPSFERWVKDDEKSPKNMHTRPSSGKKLFGAQPHVPYVQKTSPALSMSRDKALEFYQSVFVKDELRYVASTFRALLLSHITKGNHSMTVPVWTTPLFMDPGELKSMLVGIDVPVKQFIFVWNLNRPQMREALAPLRMYPSVPFGLQIVEHPHVNIGFSASINTGILQGLKTFKHRGWKAPSWFFAVNADVSFKQKQVGRLSFYANRHWKEYGLFYSELQEHYAFGISLAAVVKVGLLDEVFYPAYMEDIDYRWRVRMCGLGQILTGARFQHVRNANLKKTGYLADEYRNQRRRAQSGFQYGRYKWGLYQFADIYEHAAPSGWRTPFNIPGAPLSLWAVDPAHRQCVATGHGPMRPKMNFCWYNGTVLRERVGMDSLMPRTIVEPEPRQGYQPKKLDNLDEAHQWSLSKGDIAHYPHQHRNED